MKEKHLYTYEMTFVGELKASDSIEAKREALKSIKRGCRLYPARTKKLIKVKKEF